MTNTKEPVNTKCRVEKSGGAYILPLYFKG
jgi:hypothetical protein